MSILSLPHCAVKRAVVAFARIGRAQACVGNHCNAPEKHPVTTAPGPRLIALYKVPIHPPQLFPPRSVCTAFYSIYNPRAPLCTSHSLAPQPSVVRRSAAQHLFTHLLATSERSASASTRHLRTHILCLTSLSRCLGTAIPPRPWTFSTTTRSDKSTLSHPSCRTVV
jgi:hypothetical protein